MFQPQRTQRTQRILVLWASSRADGETFKCANIFEPSEVVKKIALHDELISPFDYQHTNEKDDFLKISKTMIKSQTIVFITPVYWYAMASQMKILFDRLSDLITIRKKDGRALAGKNVFLVANGTGENMPEGFEIPFRSTSNYYEMNFIDSCYVHTGKDKILHKKTWSNLTTFKDKILCETSAHSVCSVV